MRGVTLLLIAGTLTAAGAGCQESGFDERRETSRPLKVQHAGDPPREAKVPGQAERPATLSEDALGDTLALGLRPSLAGVSRGQAPDHLAGRLDGVTLVSSEAVDLDTLEAADPDVILGSEDAHEDLLPSLVKVAPTVLNPGTSADWKRGVRLHGEALGRVNDAEGLLVDWDRRVAAARDALGEGAPPKIAVLLVEPDGMRMASSRSFAGSVLSDLGLARRPDPGDEEEPSFTTLQPDRVAALKADMILLSVAPRAGGAARRLQSSAAWRGLDGRVERVDPSIWWGPGGILAGRAALADLQRILQP